jgi:hypothetical protein
MGVGVRPDSADIRRGEEGGTPDRD